MKPSFLEERDLWKNGIKFVIGVDEVGRGAFAGPIVAAGVVFPYIRRVSKKLKFLKEVNDSKVLKAVVRRRLAEKIKKHALFWTVSEVDIKAINMLGIGRANYMVIRRVVKSILSHQINGGDFFLLCDGFRARYVRGIGLKRQKAIIDGDKKSITIAAASILAKVHRDKLMRNLSKEFPQYRLARNKGYGTRKHQEALKIYGLSKIHRTSFDLNKFLTQSL